ncbi:MAG: DNA repair protein RecN [Eubacteriales bacterium]|nr:DNA repair protein RecN [Eubacteriales bacterium]MDD4422001.1 DNA repair protein RecN [Eubacteriales bacterium]
MLSSVHIENIALIKNIDITFSGGFTVLTGETGAGKSIIIDALSLLCGARGDREIIRSGEENAVVEGLFTDLGKKTLAALASFDVSPDEDGILLIRRQLSFDGRTVAKIGTRQVPISRLREISPLLIAIHGQQDTQILADEQEQLRLLDGFAENGDLLRGYEAEYTKYTSLKEKLRDLKRAEEDKSFRLDMINYKISEIEKAKLSEGEEERLVSEKTLLSNSEKIIANSNEAYDNIYREPGCALDRISKAISSLKQLSGIIPEADGIIERLNNISYELDDISETLVNYSSPDEENPVLRLDAVEERLEQISSLKRKYKTDIEGILKEYSCLREEKNDIEYSTEIIDKLDLQIKQQKLLLEEKSNLLNKSRKNAAAVLTEKVKDTLTFLDMPAVRFEISFSENEYGRNGNCGVSFLISANTGEEPKPIAKIASGGELSRLMLALKSIPAELENPVMIFDEIDSGISGKTSEKIGIKLSQTAENTGTQVICVTHSAQIAARADTHLLISKDESDGRTSTSVTELNGERRVDELARIIGGVKITDTVRKTAEEMLKT